MEVSFRRDGHPPVTKREREIHLNGTSGVKFKTRIETFDPGFFFVIPKRSRGTPRRASLRSSFIPGAFTPTEIYNAWSLGADIVKIFPAVHFGPEYLRAIRGPLPHIPIMPTSGVGASNVADWFRAGAIAVGAVSSVLDPELIRMGDWDALTKRAREFIAGGARRSLRLAPTHFFPHLNPLPEDEEDQLSQGNGSAGAITPGGGLWMVG